MSTKEESLSEKVSNLQDTKSALQLEIAKLSAQLEKEENVRHQAVDLQIELENRSQALQQELEKTRERENRLMEDSKELLDKLVQTEKSSTSLELQLKVLSAKYEQEVKAIHKEMERRSPAADKEDQVKGKLSMSSRILDSRHVSQRLSTFLLCSSGSKISIWLKFLEFPKFKYCLTRTI
jgi:predicted  nucleic acid-binding Zn-ribbon protein